MNITVYLGANEGNDPALGRAVHELGQWIGGNGHTLVYGGSKTGLMGEIAKSVLDAGGNVTGVEPQFFMDEGFQYDGLTELIVTKVQSFVNGDMGERFAGFAPFVAAIMGLSAFSSLSSLLGLYPATSDLNIVAGWAILVFILITHYKLKGGIGPYLKGFVEPIPIFAPFNVIGEIATPVSMAFRHYGNVLSGVVISTLVAAGLSGLSSLLLGWLPGVLGRFPLLRIGLPAILSLYFDLFSGCLQAFIFAMLTMLYISNGFPEEDYEKRRKKKAEKALRASRQH